MNTSFLSKPPAALGCTVGSPLLLESKMIEGESIDISCGASGFTQGFPPVNAHGESSDKDL